MRTTRRQTWLGAIALLVVTKLAVSVSVVHAPFEGSVNDVPITTLSRGIEIDLRQMIDDDPASIPPPIEARHHTLT